MKRPRLLIEDWLPAAAIGVECIRERSTGQQPPDKRLHVWWARRPLCAARAAVLGSLLPADFPRETFERLLGFWGSSAQILSAQGMLDWARAMGGDRIQNPHGERAFRAGMREDDLAAAHSAAQELWGRDIAVIDPMAGGGAIPLEAARLGFRALANEYNPVACAVLEATVDYPFRLGAKLGEKTRHWGAVLRERFNARVEKFFPKVGQLPAHCYIFARTVPCPDTQHPTPLVPDWHLMKVKGGVPVVAVPIVDARKGTWRVQIREIGREAGRLASPPRPTYSDGKGVSLFREGPGGLIPADYIKAKALAGEMKSMLYAVVTKTPQGFRFQAPSAVELAAIEMAEKELAKLRANWENTNVIPTEKIPVGDKTGEPMDRGIAHWADMFAPRQLLCFGVLVEEIKQLRNEIIRKEGATLGEAVVHLLAFVIDKFANYNSILCSWHVSHTVMRSVFDRHDYAVKMTFAEMAPCTAGSGFDWAITSVCDSYESLCEIPRHPNAQAAEISLGTGTNLPQLSDRSIAAVIVDPPYADNVQYSELADFFYVWLKRTQGHRRPEWFSTYLCEHDQEAVVNISRHRENVPRTRGKRDGSAAEAKAKANAFYRNVMSDIFRESRRILRDDGALTVMFTHKKQEAWEALFTSLIEAGFTITTTWPVKTE